jgi:hypothetical protein
MKPGGPCQCCKGDQHQLEFGKVASGERENHGAHTFSPLGFLLLAGNSASSWPGGVRQTSPNTREGAWALRAASWRHAQSSSPPLPRLQRWLRSWSPSVRAHAPPFGNAKGGSVRRLLHCQWAAAPGAHKAADAGDMIAAPSADLQAAISACTPGNGTRLAPSLRSITLPPQR